MYEKILEKNKLKLNIIVATSGDTGAAAIRAIKDRKNMKIFVLHPDNKISEVQRKFMTTTNSNNVFNIALDGNFDDCQKLVKLMFADRDFSEEINMSGVNSINWARVVAQIVYYFTSYQKLNSKKISFSVPTGNFGDILAGWVAKKMGLPVDKLIVATNDNDILHRAIARGDYFQEEVKATISPSMDIQISSNFERLLFEALKRDSEELNRLIDKLNAEKGFKINSSSLEFIRNDFTSGKATEKDISKTIKHAENLIDQGCHGVAILGSTGQAQLISLEEKIKLIEELSKSKYKENFIVGTGFNSLSDTILLMKTRQLLDMKKFLIMPPAYYFYQDKDVINFYNKIIENISDCKIILYNFEKLCGYKFSIECVETLAKKYPKQIIGVKDSTYNFCLLYTSPSPRDS